MVVLGRLDDPDSEENDSFGRPCLDYQPRISPGESKLELLQRELKASSREEYGKLQRHPARLHNYTLNSCVQKPWHFVSSDFEYLDWFRQCGHVSKSFSDEFGDVLWRKVSIRAIPSMFSEMLVEVSAFLRDRPEICSRVTELSLLFQDCRRGWPRIHHLNVDEFKKDICFLAKNMRLECLALCFSLDSKHILDLLGEKGSYSTARIFNQFRVSKEFHLSINLHTKSSVAASGGRCSSLATQYPEIKELMMPDTRLKKVAPPLPEEDEYLASSADKCRVSETLD
ncbi:hypothetical protein BJ875DRAFT_480960 [Amylocarpus encephaloides]|uniref:Uncharacterized protein n=1 Tax=Amylocarpus encephaloides TaxID=45428 RepID=A0A9P7YQE4_9HELO|nr:hypothetical protein BJ875DRAFT_480960 [Amylocarpus encephaloides]